MIGFEESALERADLARALGHDPVIFIGGGHNADATPQARFDEPALRAAIDSSRDGVYYAVAGVSRPAIPNMKPAPAT